MEAFEIREGLKGELVSVRVISVSESLNGVLVSEQLSEMDEIEGLR